MTPRRVLISSDALGGLWRYAIDLARSLSARGVETLLVGMGPQPNEEQRADALSVPGLELRWPALPLDWTATSEAEIAGVPAAFAAIARGAGIDLLHLNLPTQAMDIPTDLPIVVGAHSCLATWWAAVHGDQPLLPAWEWNRGCSARGFARADLVITPSEAHSRALQEVYGPLPNLVAVHNASPQWTGPDTEKGAFIFSAGRWWDEAKNLATLDAAAARTRWPVRIAGALSGPDGTQRSVQHARHAGRLSRAEMDEVLATAPIFVSPALYEPFGLAVLEAAQAGAALVLSDIASFRELWHDAAVFVDPLDAAALATALNRLADDAGERQRLVKAARVRAARYSLPAQADATLAVYERALHLHQASAPV
jgi:glycosyltransferase involved in cell wall biosynthesis